MENLLKQNINAWKSDRGLPPYADKTINKYLADIRKLAPEDYEDMFWANDTEMVAKKLSKYKYTTQRNYYNSLLVGLYASGMVKGEGVAAIYEAKRDLLNAEYDKVKGQNTPSQNLVLNKIKPADLDRMLQEMSKDLGTRQTHMAYVLFHIYKYYQFRNDVAGMQIFINDIFEEIEEQERSENNYIVLGRPKDSMSFILNNYKTSAKYGEKSIEIEHPELRAVLRNWIKVKVSGDWDKIRNKVVYLFDWGTGNPLTRNDISHILSQYSLKYTGHSISTTLLRKIYGNIPVDVNEASDEEIKEVIKQANASGHSVQTKGAVYSK